MYDAVADRYDSHFGRPVDRWEDTRLAGVLARHVNGRRTLDLGCGTGWVADHCTPSAYTGLDASDAMLARCHAKHRGARLIRADIGERGWANRVPDDLFDVITCTWSAHYLGDLTVLLTELRAFLDPLGPQAVILHGCGPRYSHRPHYIANGDSHLHFTPAAVKRAAAQAGWNPPRVTGCGALPDGLTWLGPLAWQAALAVPARCHYSAAYTWTGPCPSE
jgi:SAM-dependent methyltransferase